MAVSYKLFAKCLLVLLLISIQGYEAFNCKYTLYSTSFSVTASPARYMYCKQGCCQITGNKPCCSFGYTYRYSYNYNSYYGIGSGITVVIALVAIVCCCCRRRRAMATRTTTVMGSPVVYSSSNIQTGYMPPGTYPATPAAGYPATPATPGYNYSAYPSATTNPTSTYSSLTPGNDFAAPPPTYESVTAGQYNKGFEATAPYPN